MRIFSFTFLLLVFFIIFIPFCCGYYYYYNYLAKSEIVILKSNNSDYKTKQKIIRNFDDDKLIYKSRLSNFEENNFSLIDSRENPKKISNIIDSRKSIYNVSEQENSIFTSNQINDDSEIKVILSNSTNKRQTQFNKEKGIYFIELGVFKSKDQAERILKEMQDSSKKSLNDIPTLFRLVNYGDKVFVKLIIPSINSFSQSRQICKIIKEFQTNCLIKTY